MSIQHAIAFGIALGLANIGASFGITLDPGASLAISRIDPTDSSLAGATESVQNSNFIASTPSGPSSFDQGSFLSQVIKQSSDGSLAFHYQFSSTGQTPIYLQAFTLTAFGGQTVDIGYLAPASQSQIIDATRSVDGTSIRITWATGAAVPIVIRTKAAGFDTLGTVNLNLVDPGGPGAPPVFLTATATAITPAPLVGGPVPEPDCLAMLGIAAVALGIRLPCGRFLADRS